MDYSLFQNIFAYHHAHLRLTAMWGTAPIYFASYIIATKSSQLMFGGTQKSCPPRTFSMCNKMNIRFVAWYFPLRFQNITEASYHFDFLCCILGCVCTWIMQKVRALVWPIHQALRWNKNAKALFSWVWSHSNILLVPLLQTNSI